MGFGIKCKRTIVWHVEKLNLEEKKGKYGKLINLYLD